MSEEKQKIFVSWFPIYHGMAFIKHILAQFYINQPPIEEPNFELKGIIQEESEEIWGIYNSGFMFDKVYIIYPDNKTHENLSGILSEYRRRSFLVNDEVLKSNRTWEKAWNDIMDKNFEHIQEEINYIDSTYPDIADQLKKLYWRNIQHYYAEDQIWWLMNLSNLPEKYKRRFEFIKVDNIRNPRDYKEVTTLIYNNFEKIQKAEGNAEYYINIGLAGVQVSTAWFAIGQAGLLPQKTRYLEAYDIKNSRKGKRFQSFYIKEVPTALIKDVLEKISLYDYKTTSKRQLISEGKFKTYLKQGFSILLLGERGIGKSHMAQKYAKDENIKNFIAVNCASFIDSHIAEAELFGYRKGAFTDAKEDKKGLIEAADGGILFMDEIHTLPKDIQFKLMRAFATDEENKMTIRRIGDTREKKIQLKALIFASNRTIEQLREVLLPDFFDRIAQLIIELPPLRQTPEIIPEAFKIIWEQLRFHEIGYEFNNYPGKDKQLLDWIQELPLYGNYRDLQKIAINYKTYLEFPKYLKEMIPQKTAFEYTKAMFIKYLTNTHKADCKEYFSEDKTHKQMLAEFKHDLAQWAINRFGSAPQAVKHFNSLGEKITQETLYKWRTAGLSK